MSGKHAANPNRDRSASSSGAPNLAQAQLPTLADSRVLFDGLSKADQEAFLAFVGAKPEHLELTNKNAPMFLSMVGSAVQNGKIVNLNWELTFYADNSQGIRALRHEESGLGHTTTQQRQASFLASILKFEHLESLDLSAVDPSGKIGNLSPLLELKQLRELVVCYPRMKDTKERRQVLDQLREKGVEVSYSW